MSRGLLAALAPALLLPFAVAALGVLALRLRFGTRQAVPVASLAQLAGFLAAYALLLGLPSWPPVMARDKIAWIAAGGVLLGLLLLMLPRWADALQAAVLAWPLAIVIWLAAPAALEVSRVLPAALLALFGAAMIGPLAGARQRNPRRALMLLSALAGLAGIAALAQALSFAALALALAAGLAGAQVASRTPGLANAALLGPSGAALALAATLVLYSAASRLALALLALVFAADWLARRRPVGHRLWLGRLLFAAGCLLPPTLALLVARSGPAALLP
jgi:hypothetical protein